MTDGVTIQGYASSLAIASGETISFYLSVEPASEYRADIVRLRHGDTTPGGPGFRERHIPTDIEGNYLGRTQFIDAGSAVVVEDPDARLGLVGGAFMMTAFVWPTTSMRPLQVIVGRGRADTGEGCALMIHDGVPQLWCGGEFVARGAPLQERCWYFIAVGADPVTNEVMIYSKPVVTATNSLVGRIVSLAGGVVKSILPRPVTSIAALSTPITIAGLAAGKDDVIWHFNGKIERPSLWSRLLREQELDALALGDEPPASAALVASWDFSIGLTAKGVGDDVVDVGPHRMNGQCRNFPQRAMTGVRWDGEVECFHHAPNQYGAIHFHEDDLEDARWEADQVWTVPAGTASGVYALRVRCGDKEEHFPFFVRPSRGARGDGKVLVVMPTASYLAYANETTLIDAPVTQAIYGHTGVLTDRDIYLYAHPEYGLSTYDRHVDGSGVHYSSALRPIVGFRPRHRAALGGPWQFPADLYLIDWLDELGFDYDVVTDRDLHDEGSALLKSYRIALTGTHPEYYSKAMLDAWEEYLVDGGRAVYLGGNGFYWATAWHPDKPHLMEVRKGDGATRASEAQPGEMYLQATGERSGIWRQRGRAPQKLFGVGFAAQGMDVSSSYVQMPDARDPQVAFIMAGIDPSERIGDFGLLAGGAAGYELDRYDRSLGTPPYARLLAYSNGHTAAYHRVVEEILATQPNLNGRIDPHVRSDLVYFPTPQGGAVFSVGSIAWCGALSHNGYRNNVSTITANVVRRFLEDSPLPPLWEHTVEHGDLS